MKENPDIVFLCFLGFCCFLLFSCGKLISKTHPIDEITISKTDGPISSNGSKQAPNPTTGKEITPINDQIPSNGPTQYPSATSTQEITPVAEVKPTESRPKDLFESKYCPISIRQGEGWVISEIAPGEPGSRSLYGSTVELLKDQYSLAIICFFQADDKVQRPGGRGAGDQVSVPEIKIIDKTIHGQGTVWEGLLVSVLYKYQRDQLSFFADLGSNPYFPPSDTGEVFSIPDSILFEVLGILESITLTGPIDIKLPTPPSNDPQIILEMGDYYHSQITEIGLPNACAPTAGFIVLDYLQEETSLDEVAQLLMEDKPDRGGYDPSCTRNIVCTSPMTLAQRISSEYHLTIHTKQGWTLESVHEALLAGHPIIADILWRLDGYSIGHFVVIFGVDIDQELIYYHDPIDGANQLTSWTHFSQRWKGPVDVGDPTYLQGFEYWGMEVYSEDWDLYQAQ
jgi:uncharacterized protein YvpB